MKRNVIGAVLITVLVLGALAAAAFGMYQIGYRHGLVETGAEVVINSAEPGMYPGFWGFGFLGIFFKILIVMLIVGLIARVFFGWRHWGPGPYWTRDWHDGQAPPMEQRLTDWHQKAHSGDPTDKPEPRPGSQDTG